MAPKKKPVVTAPVAPAAAPPAAAPPPTVAPPNTPVTRAPKPPKPVAPPVAPAAAPAASPAAPPAAAPTPTPKSPVAAPAAPAAPASSALPPRTPTTPSAASTVNRVKLANPVNTAPPAAPTAPKPPGRVASVVSKTGNVASKLGNRAIPALIRRAGGPAAVLAELAFPPTGEAAGMPTENEMFREAMMEQGAFAKRPSAQNNRFPEYGANQYASPPDVAEEKQGAASAPDSPVTPLPANRIREYTMPNGTRSFTNTAAGATGFEAGGGKENMAFIPPRPEAINTFPALPPRGGGGDPELAGGWERMSGGGKFMSLGGDDSRFRGGGGLAGIAGLAAQSRVDFGRQRARTANRELANREANTERYNRMADADERRAALEERRFERETELYPQEMAYKNAQLEGERARTDLAREQVKALPSKADLAQEKIDQAEAASLDRLYQEIIKLPEAQQEQAMRAFGWRQQKKQPQYGEIAPAVTKPHYFFWEKEVEPARRGILPPPEPALPKR